MKIVKLAVYVIALGTATVVHAQASLPRYDKLIGSTQSIGVLGKDLAGDSTNFYTGATNFAATDLSVPGNNGLEVAVGRYFSIEPAHTLAEVSSTGQLWPYPIVSNKQFAFGDWDLDIPSLSGTYTQEFGWQNDSTTPLNRCSVLGQLRADGQPSNGNARRQTYKPDYQDFWFGNTLRVHGDEQAMLLATEASANRPSGGTYHWTTNKGWWFSCLPSAANAPGEAFLAIAPDGTKYRFDWMSSRPSAAQYHTEDEFTPYRTFYTWTQDVFMLPTTVEDRFGNWVKYEYSADTFAKLQKITSSDGRSISLTYNAQGYVETITDGVRTIGYLYTGNHLTTVVLPDGSSWQYGLESATYGNEQPPASSSDTCVHPEQLPPYECVGWPAAAISFSGYVVHPSGARVDFVFQSHFQWLGAGWAYPVGISEKTISGPGIAPQKWYYAFSPTVDEVKFQCRAGACPSRVWTDEVGPDYRVIRRLFGLKELEDQGLLLQQLRGYVPVAVTTSMAPSTGPRILHSQRGLDMDIADDGLVVDLGSSVTVTGSPVFLEESDYFYRVGQKVGSNPLWLNLPQNAAQVFWSERRLPASQRTTHLQGETFTWQVNAWDSFDRPLQVSKFSTLNAGRVETTEYQDDLGKWVLGLVKKKTVSGISQPVEETIFDSNLLPWKLYASGKLQQTLTYNADGTLSTVSDGRDGIGGAETTVTLSNWKRGIPQSIQYPATPESPAGASQSAVVNNAGWIEQVTDENGFSTSYGYDLAGRLNRITYPTNDTVAWNQTTMSFAPVAVAEMGIGAGHWKQVVTTGNAQKVTYFDALWRPVVEESFDAANKAATLSQIAKRYDGDGRVIFQSTAQRGISDFSTVSQGSRTAYDGLGRPARVEQDTELGSPAISTIEYLAGFKRKTTNPRLQSTVESFQAFEAPSYDAPVQVDAPENVRSSIVRDIFGKPTQISRGAGS